MHAELRCQCGQRIFSRDIIHRGNVVRPIGGRMVYVRFRCPRCRKLGEQYIRRDEWDLRMIYGVEPEVTPAERARFDRMGPITEEEIQRVRESEGTLEELRALDEGS